MQLALLNLFWWPLDEYSCHLTGVCGAPDFSRKLQGRRCSAAYRTRFTHILSHLVISCGERGWCDLIWAKDTASSLQTVLRGRRSQFINRTLVLSPCAMSMWFTIDSSLTLNRLRFIEIHREQVCEFENRRARYGTVYAESIYNICIILVFSASLNSHSKILCLTPAQGRLSYGMAKNPVDYLAAVQRWAEGGVVLSLQTFFSCHKGALLSNVGPAGSGEDPSFVHFN